ncbi:zinc-dependent metalloprotease [Desertivirga xinjiangensis]|uniref:zinc-dependent metalloprotease n=1 Tax=Desertivirga xinjiangensis TaxID=539206 RepID=UPI00210A2E29|nr:zinc-dependent metalloprotease [Pedobacter xinjiangensis]
MLKSSKTLLGGAICGALLISGCAILKKKKKVSLISPIEAVDPAKKTADSLKKAKALKPYSDVVGKGTKTQTGFFTVHQKDNKFYFEIPNNILKREILVVSRIAKASSDMRNGSSGYAGDQIGETVYSFEKGPDNKLFLRRRSYSEYAKDSTMTLFAALEKNNVSAIVATFPVLTMPSDSSAVVVDVTEFLNSDNDVLYFQKKIFKERAGMAGQINDRSYIDYVHTYNTNVEIRAVKTYNAGINPNGSVFTIELNSSLVLLPLKPMKGRLADARVGYFTTAFKDFGADPQGVTTTAYIKRWRLEPKPEDMEKYKRGELVEPVKPIVFYIDPVTPKKWVPYLIAGVNDWQKAFEAAGFKNAVLAKEAPTREQDSTWSIDDARHSAIIYRPSSVANAMGPSTSDPRSGEILESHIFWYHNVMSLLQRWYRLQAGAADPAARKPEFDDELMGTLIRFVSSHEIGHALGLLHNFGASSRVPVEKLRDKKWLESHGHTPSIMDYARFNYVAQPEDKIPQSGLFPKIGDYDLWAIKWGYSWLPDYQNPEAETPYLIKMVTDSIRRNKNLWFGSELEASDPRSQNEDLGDNAMKAGYYGIKNLKRIAPELHKWVNVPTEGQEKLNMSYSDLWLQFGRYLGHVSKNIAGEYHTVKINAEPGLMYQPVPYEIQKEAVGFLNKEIFSTPMWLNTKIVLNRLNSSFGVELNQLQKSVIESVFTRANLSRLLINEQEFSVRTYTVKDLLRDFDKGINAEIYSARNIDFYRRNLQKNYVYRLCYMNFFPNEASLIGFGRYYNIATSDLSSYLSEELRRLQSSFRRAAANTTLNKETRSHLRRMDAFIESKFVADRNGIIPR